MGGFVIIMYSKKLHFTKEVINSSIKENAPISRELINKLKGLYSAKEYSVATMSLFDEPNILMTRLTSFQANMLVVHAKLLNALIKEKEESDTTQRKSIKPYRNIWNTLEKRTR